MKHVILFLLLLISTSLPAQQKTKLGFTGGVNIARYKLNAGFFAFSTSSKPGILAGVMADIPVEGHLYFQPATQFMSSSYRLNYFGLDIAATIRTLMVPVNFLYKPGYEEKRKFYVGVGPYFCLNFVAKEKITTGGLAAQFGINSKQVDSVVNLAKGDFGVGVNAGYNFTEHFLVQAHFQKGLANVFLDLPGFSVKNYNYGITLGYLFFKKDKPVKRKPVNRVIHK